MFGPVRGFRPQPTVFLFLAALFLTLGLHVFPYYYASLPAWGYWLLAALTVGGYVLSVFARELVRRRRSPGELPLYFFGTGSPTAPEVGTKWRRVGQSVSALALTGALAAVFLGLMIGFGKLGAPAYVSGLCFHLAAANLTLFGFHLLPVLPLDGGRFWLRVFSRGARPGLGLVRALYATGYLVIAAFLVAGADQVLHHKPILGGWLLFVAVLLVPAHAAAYQTLRVSERSAPPS